MLDTGGIYLYTNNVYRSLLAPQSAWYTSTGALILPTVAPCHGVYTIISRKITYVRAEFAPRELASGSPQ